MSKQKITKENMRTVRIAADIEADVIASMDQERSLKGQCSRAAIIRMALAERYQKNRPAQTRSLPCR